MVIRRQEKSPDRKHAVPPVKTSTVMGWGSVVVYVCSRFLVYFFTWSRSGGYVGSIPVARSHWFYSKNAPGCQHTASQSSCLCRRSKGRDPLSCFPILNVLFSFAVTDATCAPTCDGSFLVLISEFMQGLVTGLIKPCDYRIKPTRTVL